MIFPLFRRSANQLLLERLHGEIVAGARQRVLFIDYGIEDTPEGRFESLALHATVVLRRLNTLPPPGPELAQDLADAIFFHFEAALREAGVGDASVPKRMKAIAEAFRGRGLAYDEALGEGELALAAALSRNVYAGRGNAARLARYIAATSASLANAEFDVFAKGQIPFLDPALIS